MNLFINNTLIFNFKLKNNKYKLLIIVIVKVVRTTRKSIRMVRNEIYSISEVRNLIDPIMPDR